LSSWPKLARGCTAAVLWGAFLILHFLLVALLDISSRVMTICLNELISEIYNLILQLV
jgi:hypothetical protein